MGMFYWPKLHGILNFFAVNQATSFIADHHSTPIFYDHILL
jgi:hypothetical protein